MVFRNTILGVTTTPSKIASPERCHTRSYTFASLTGRSLRTRLRMRATIFRTMCIGKLRLAHELVDWLLGGCKGAKPAMQ
jgi:hypothetical protein